MKKFLEKIKVAFQKVAAFMDKAYNYVVGALGQDGLMHILVCVILTLLIGGICNAIHIVKDWCFYIPLITVMAVGLGKELFDLCTPNHTAEFKDIMCDFVGTSIGLIILALTLI